MCRDHSRRRAFTVIELLVAITVITLMAALLVGASYRFVVGSREAATAATITKVSGIVQDRVRAFQEFDFSDAAIILTNVWNSSHTADAIMSQGLADVLIRKARFKKAFPQAFAELDSSQLARFFPSAVSIPPASPYDPKYEPGIVLYAMLLKGETFGAATPKDDTFSGAEVKIAPETGGLPCLVDAWGEPLRFYRWPTRLLRCGEQDFDGNGTFDDYNLNGTQDGPGAGSPAIRPFSSYPGSTPASLLLGTLPPFERTNTAYVCGRDGHPGVATVDDDNQNGVDDPGETGWPDTDDPETLNTDPDDPAFKLSQWLFDPQGSRTASFVFGTSTYSFLDAYHDFYTFQTPLIVSAGPDKQLGLWEPTDIPTAANTTSVNCGFLAAPKPAPACMQNLFDNITNLNQRAGGK